MTPFLVALACGMGVVVTALLSAGRTAAKAVRPLVYQRQTQPMLPPAAREGGAS